MTHLTSNLAVIVFIVTLSTTSELVAEPKSGALYFGWAQTSITPEKPVAICGQYHTRISGKVNDPILATALAIETRDGDKVIGQAVFVSCDLVAIRGLVQEKTQQRLQGKIAGLDATKVILSATHTHTAPALTDAAEAEHHPHDFMGSWAYRIPTGRKDVMRPAEYVEFLVERLGEVVAEAWKARRPGGISSALGHAVVAHNRRAVFADGTARMYGNTSDRNFSHIEGVSDHSVDVLFLWRGETLEGMAVNVYCPSQEVEGEQYISSDFWFDTRKLLRETFGEDLRVLPLCGASGDQSPHLMWNKNAELTLRARAGRSTRQEIAHRIVRAVKQNIGLARKHVRTEIPLEHRVETVPLPVWKVSDERLAAARVTFESGKGKADQLPSRDYINWRVSRTLIARHEHQEKNPNYLAELHFLRLGEVAIATNPFELYTDYGLRIKSRSPAGHTMVVQLTADAAAYLPTARAVTGGGYSARIVDGVVGPEGGDVLVNESVKVLNELWSGR